MNRRAFITSLSAIPAVALFPALLKADPKPLPPWEQMALMYQAMASFGDHPDALFMSVKRMEQVANGFNLKPDYDEFQSPWGGDICGTPGISDDRIEVAAGLGRGEPRPRAPRSTLYLFDWEKDSFVRHQAGHLAVSYRMRKKNTGSYVMWVHDPCDVFEPLGVDKGRVPRSLR